MSEPTFSLPPSKGKAVVITGINGYLASVTGLAILKKGYTLIGTCRSRVRAEPLLADAYAEYDRAGRVKIVEVADMTTEGAFDEAVKGAYGIIHTASPVNLRLTNPALVVGPAVAGTTGILHSALKHSGPQLSAVVITSSVAAIASPSPPDHVFTEEDWNNYAEKQVEEAAGADCPPNVCYAASKTAAEKVIWAFREREKPPFAISSLNPTFIYGPPLITHSTPTHLNETVRPIYDFLASTTPDSAVPARVSTGGYVDVRDVATSHIWALEHPSISDGHRYIVSAGLGPPQALVDILRDAYPDRKGIPVGTPGEGYIKGSFGWVEGEVALSAKKLEEAMGGFKWILLDQSILDTAKYMERYL